MASDPSVQFERSEALQLIDILWGDIHNTRNRDWQVLLIVFTVAVVSIPSHSSGVYLGLLALASATALVGMKISVSHWKITHSKMTLIVYIESIVKLDRVTSAVRKPGRSVSAWVTLMYGLIATTYSTLFAYNLWFLSPTETSALCVVVFSTILFLTFVVAFVYMPEELHHFRTRQYEILAGLAEPKEKKHRRWDRFREKVWKSITWLQRRDVRDRPKPITHN